MMMEREEGIETLVPDEVLELLEERRRVQGWMEKLHELQAETTPTVYQKVRTDYEGRLREMNGRLAEHRSDLESSVARHRSRVEKLQAERDEAATRLEEAELRHRVGEFAEDEWERRRGEGEAAIGELDASLSHQREALARLERILEDLVSGRREAVETEAADTETGGDDAPARAAGAGADADVRSGTDDARATGPEERLVKDWGSGGRRLVADASSAEEPRSAEESRSRAGGGAGAADAPVEEDVAGEEAAAGYLDELEFLESLSLDDAERFDAVSLMLDENEEEGDGEEAREGERSP